MSVTGSVAVREKLFDELHRLDAEADRIRSRRTEIRNALRLLHELGAIDLDSEGGNGRRPNETSESEAPEPRAAPDPPAAAEDEIEEVETPPAEAEEPKPPRKRAPAPTRNGTRKGQVRCPACEQEMAPFSLSGHISTTHKLPRGTQFNPEAFDRMLVDAGLSSVEIAKRLTALVGTGTNSSVDNWRKGRAQPGLPFVEALAELLGCTTGDLVWRKK